MPVKRAKFISFGEDPLCLEIKNYIEETGIILELRDLAEKPFTVPELKKIIGYLDVSHFLNPMAPSYSKKKLDEKLPERNELFEILAEDYTLIRKPIILTPRLMTVGCNKQKIMEMLQLSGNSYHSDSNHSNSHHSNTHRSNNHRRTNPKSSDRETVGGK